MASMGGHATDPAPRGPAHDEGRRDGPGPRYGRTSLAERAGLVKEHARQVGFDRVGIASTGVAPAYDRYRQAAAWGFAADMGWLVAHPELRRDVRAVHPSARSVVALSVSYASGVPGYLAGPPPPGHGWIARYAQGKDYHVHVRKMLVRLARRLARDPALGYPSVAHRVFTDTGPVLERAFAARAGLGWIGRNTMLIDQALGSYTFLAVVLTPLELAPDAPVADRCGSCRRCVEACPTGALGPHLVDAFRGQTAETDGEGAAHPTRELRALDARRCISAWTIEAQDPASVIDRERLGSHVFGCDICQEVCPWNRRVPPTRHEPLRPRAENVRPALAPLTALDDEGFRRRFPRSAVRRVDAARLGAVARIVLGQEEPGREASFERPAEGDGRAC